MGGKGSGEEVVGGCEGVGGGEGPGEGKGPWDGKGSGKEGKDTRVDGSGLNGRGIKGWCVMGDCAKFGIWARGEGN